MVTTSWLHAVSTRGNSSERRSANIRVVRGDEIVTSRSRTQRRGQSIDRNSESRYAGACPVIIQWLSERSLSKLKLDRMTHKPNSKATRHISDKPEYCPLCRHRRTTCSLSPDLVKPGRAGMCPNLIIRVAWSAFQSVVNRQVNFVHMIVLCRSHAPSSYLDSLHNRHY